jgi:hypothetical protein
MRSVVGDASAPRIYGANFVLREFCDFEPKHDGRDDTKYPQENDY